MKISYAKHFKKVIEEVKRSYDLFVHDKEYLKKGIVVPRGINLYGELGSGKTELLKAIVMNTDVNPYVYSKASPLQIQVNQASKERCIFMIDDFDNCSDEVIKEFKDMLINHQNLNENLFVIVTSEKPVNLKVKDVRDILKPIELVADSDEDKVEIFNELINSTSIELKEELNPKYLIPMLKDMSIGDMEEVLNYIAINYGFNNISENDVLDAINFTSGNYLKLVKDKSRYIAVHEAGHALINHKLDYLDVVALTIRENGGACKVVFKKDSEITYEVILDRIKADLAGLLACKLLLKTGDVGCADDIGDAKYNASFLINRAGYKGVSLTLPHIMHDPKRISEINNRHNDLISKRIIKKEAREVNKYLKNHKDELVRLSEALYYKGNLNIKEINEILN